VPPVPSPAECDVAEKTAGEGTGGTKKPYVTTG